MSGITNAQNILEDTECALVYDSIAGSFSSAFDGYGGKIHEAVAAALQGSLLKRNGIFILPRSVEIYANGPYSDKSTYLECDIAIKASIVPLVDGSKADFMQFRDQLAEHLAKLRTQDSAVVCETQIGGIPLDNL